MSGRAAPRLERPGDASRGFTYIEVLIAGGLLTVVMLALCGVFMTGYAGVATSGRTSVGVTAARQMMEAIRLLPFDSVGNLNGFDTDIVATLPATGVEREIARRWRYVLAGDGVGWTFTPAERTRWTSLTLGEGLPISGKGTVVVAAKTPTLWEVTVSVSIPGRFKPLALKTYVARLS